MDFEDAPNKPHRPKKTKKVAKDSKGRNPKAFAYNAPNKLARIQQRNLDREYKRLHVPIPNAIPIGDVPFIVAVQGPPGVGKSTCIKSLVKHYTKQNVKEVKGPITVVTGKNRRITLVEVPNDLNSMIDIAKVADLALLLIDAHYGFEMETFEFINILQTHGMPKVIGVLTHLDKFTKMKALKTAKKALKQRFWTEIYDGAKLFYLSGLQHERYLKRDVINLSRFISLQKFQPLIWRSTHSYVLVDRINDITSQEEIRKNKKCDRHVCLYGYVRGANLKKNSNVHIPGCGDFKISSITELEDPCPKPDKTQKQRLNEKDKLIYAPMADLGVVFYDKDAIYVELAHAPVYQKIGQGKDAIDVPEGGEGERMIRELHVKEKTIEDGLEETDLPLFTGSKPMAYKDFTKDSGSRRGVDFGENSSKNNQEEFSYDDDSSDDEDIGEYYRRNEGNEEDIENEYDDEEEDEEEEENDDDDEDGEENEEEERDDLENDEMNIESEEEDEMIADNYQESISENESNEELNYQFANKDSEEEEQDEEDDNLEEYSDDEEDEEEIIDTSELKWRKNLGDIALENFKKPTNLMKLVYEEEKSKKSKAFSKSKNNDDDDLFTLKTDNWKGADAEYNAPETSLPLNSNEKVLLENEEIQSLLKDKFLPKGTLFGGELDGSESADNDNDSESEEEEEEEEEEVSEDHSSEDYNEEDNDEKEANDETTPKEEVKAFSFENEELELRRELEGYPSGVYVRIEIEQMNYELVEHFDPRYPLIVGSLLPNEENFGFLQARVKKHRWHKKILKNNDPLIISMGWRRFQTIPIYSVEDHNGRNRMLKYTPEYMHCLATFYGPITPLNTGIIAFQKMSSKTPEFRVCLNGIITELNKSFEIVKKLKLLGYPYKIDKNTAFIKDMFNSRLEVAKFSGAAIKTVSGIRGQIKKAVRGIPGAFRATFEDKILLSDIVFMRTWYPVEPKKVYIAVKNLLLEDKEGWKGMKTIYEIRHEKNLPVPYKKDSIYRPIEERPEERKFNPLKIPKSIQENLPFKTIPKLKEKRKGPSIETKRNRLRILDPKDKKRLLVMNQVGMLKNMSLEKKKKAMKEKFEKFKKEKEKEEKLIEARKKASKKRVWIMEGKANKSSKKRKLK